jgi:hypothetical protein
VTVDLIDAGRDLLMAGRTAEALALADRQVAVVPDDVGAMVLRATCLLVLDRTPEAVAGWRAAATIAPIDPDVVHLGIRCAWAEDAPDLQEHISLLRQLEPDSPRSLHWAALLAARENRVDEVKRLLALQRRHGAADGLAERTEIACLLLLRGRRGQRRRTERAAAIVDGMLALDPGDAHAHHLRQVVTDLQLRRRPRDRELHLRALIELREAAAAGVLPAPGRQRFLVLGATGAGALAITWPVAIVVGAPIAQAGALSPVLLVVLATGVWASALYAIDRRARAVARVLPAHARRAALRPLVLTMRVAAVALAVLAAIGLAVLSPYDLDRATELRFATDGPRTVETVSYVEITIPPAPSLPPFVDGDRHAPPTMALPVTVGRVPVIRTERLPASTDPAEALRLMQFYTAACVASLAVAVALSLSSVQHTTERRPR